MSKYTEDDLKVELENKEYEYGFYTELEDAIVPADKEVFNSWRSNRNKQSNNNSNDMSKDKKGLLADVVKSANKFLGIGTKNKIVYTATSEELDFYELTDADTPAVGDKATFGGNPAGDSNNGEYVMATGETYKFTGEELTEIIPATENSDDLATENAALKAENEALKEAQTANKLEISNLKKDLKTSKNLLAQFAAIQSDEEDTEESEDKSETPARQNKAKTDKDVPTRNLFANIK